MKNFTITLDGTNRHFSIALNATTRRFTIRPGVGPQGPQGIQGATGATGPQGPAGPNTVTSATTSDGTANLSLSNVTTATATVTGTLTAEHIHGNLAGSVYAHVRAGENLAKGDPVYVSGAHGSGATLIPIVSKADASDPLKMPAVGVMDAAVTNNANGHMVITGTITELDTNAFAVNAELYVAAGGGFTSTPPTTLCQPVARVERSNTNNGAVIVKVNGLSSKSAIDNTLVRRGENGDVSFATSANDTITLNLESNGDFGGTAYPSAVKALASGSLGIGAEIYSNSGWGAVIASGTNTGALISTSSGTYHADFGSGDNRSAIERVRGWFVWFYNTFTGRLKTADITANRDWTLPDASGTIALTTSNVATATALQTARTINGVSFNGTANITITVPVSTGITGLGTSVATALAVNVGSAGAFVVNGGALGTPSSGTLTSCTGLPISTGVSGLASGIATFLQTPSSANLRAALTDPTGTGANVHASSPTITSPTINTGIAGSAVPSILQNQAGSTRPICVLFEDFPGIAGAGTHPWNDSGTGSTDAMGTGGAGQFMGTCRLITGTTSGNTRSRSLGIATSTVFIGAVVRYGFAIPDITSVSVGLGFSGGGSTCQLLYASANNSGQWTLSTNAGVTTFTTEVAQAGNYFSGKRYQLEMERISTTQVRILLEIADFNLANWSTVYSGTVTHGAVSANWGESTPSFGVTTQTNAARTLIVDWASLYLPMILR